MSAEFTGRVLLVAFAAFAVCTARPAIRAAEPTPVIRTFGFLAESHEDVPNFLGDDSIAVSVLPTLDDEQPIAICDHTTDLFADDTIWVPATAHHAATGGAAPKGTFFWLITEDTPTPPPIGAHTFTGQDSPWICAQHVKFLRVCVGGECGFGCDGKLGLFSTGPTAVFVIVTAVFSR